MAESLKQENLIRSELLFKTALNLSGLDKKIQHGEYAFQGKVSFFHIIKTFTNGNYYFRKITIPECSTVEEALQIISKNPFLSGKIKMIPSEGSIFPDTYFFQRNDNKNIIIYRMQKKMENVVDSIWIKNKTTIKSKIDLIKLASIIASEAINAEEKYVISSVFHNRIKKNMKLQSDPTVLYSKNLNNPLKTRIIYKKDLLLDNPWNTYTRLGLPLTPICNPGIEALKATIMPKNTDYLYFVSNGNGGHRFSSNYKQHLKNIELWKSKH